MPDGHLSPRHHITLLAAPAVGARAEKLTAVIQWFTGYEHLQTALPPPTPPCPHASYHHKLRLLMEKTHACKSPCIKPLGPRVGPAEEMADLQLSCLLPQKPSSKPGQGGAAAPVRHPSGELRVSPLHTTLLPVYTRHWQPCSLDNLQIF